MRFFIINKFKKKLNIIAINRGGKKKKWLYAINPTLPMK